MNDPSPSAGARGAADEDSPPSGGGPRPPRSGGTGFDSLVGQETVVESLQRALRGNHLPHALLFHGPVGVGKATCAGLLAQALNCVPSDFTDSCGSCRSCRKIARGLHPDVLWVEPTAGVIRVESARAIIESLAYRPYEGARRVVAVDDAHRLNPSAQNALLKTLEEPPGSAVIILVTPASSSLLPTVRSRCQPLRFRPLPLPELRRRLIDLHDMDPDEARLRAALTPGSLGRALELDLDAYSERREVAEQAIRGASEGGAALLAAAEALLTAGAGDRKIEQAASAVATVRNVLRDLLILNADDDDSLIVNVDRAESWRGWARRLDLDGLVAALVATQRASERLEGKGVVPNPKMKIEQALVEVGGALKARSGP